MTTLRTAAFAAVLLVSGAALQSAAAMPVANLASPADVAKTAFLFEGAVAPGRPDGLDRIDANAALTAAANYFDFDAVITLGALAVAGAAMAGLAVAAARRSAKESEPVEPVWRQTVLRALQADLAAFTATYRRAA